MAKKKAVVKADMKVRNMDISAAGIGDKWGDQFGNTIYRTDSPENKARLKKLKKKK